MQGKYFLPFIFFISCNAHFDDGETIGASFNEVSVALMDIPEYTCADSIVIVTKKISGTGDEAKIRAALEELFSIKEFTNEETGEELQSTLAKSNLTVDEVKIKEDEIFINLGGSMTYFDENCIRIPIEETIRTNVSEGTIHITFHDEDLSEAFNSTTCCEE